MFKKDFGVERGSLMESLRIGVDLGGTNIRTALIDSAGHIIKEIQKKTEAEKGADYVIKKMIQMIHQINENQKIKGIGIGAPGPLNPFNGTILNPPNLPGWEAVPIVALINKEFNLPVFLDNDANAASLAEARLGAGKGYASVFYITVSTGVGGGLVIDGQIFQGAKGYAGEVGNMVIVPNGKESPGLNPGALETLASGTAIGRAGKEKLGLSGNAEEVFKLANEGNVTAQHIIDEAVGYLAIGIANIAHILNPSIFILGGGVMNASEQILEPLRQKVQPLLYPGLRDTVEIKAAALGTKAGVIGAGMLVR